MGRRGERVRATRRAARPGPCAPSSKVALLVAALAIAFVLPAQAPLLLHLSTFGPATWRVRVGPTNLGSMLESQAAEAIWRDYADDIDAVARAARGEDAAFARERARLLGYAGAVHVVAWLEQAEDALHVARWSAALIAEPDGETDLEAMADECRLWLAKAEQSATKPWREMELSPPRLVGKRLIAVLANPEDADAAADRAATFVCEPLAHPAVLNVQLEVPSALGLLPDRAVDREFFTALLGPATQRAAWRIDSVGPRLAIDLSLEFGAGDRGVFAGLCPSGGDVPDLRWLVPDGTATHHAWRVDLPALWDGWLRARAAASEQDPAVLQKRDRQHHGCDIGADVLSKIATEAMLLWRSADEVADNPTPLANACLVLPVRDEHALIELVRAMPLRQGRPPIVDEDGVYVAELSSFGIAIGHGVACLTFDPSGDHQRDAVLACAAAGRRPEPALALPPGAPDGCNGRGHLDLMTMVVRDLYGQFLWMLWMSGTFPWAPSVAKIAVEARRWLPLLRGHRLDDAVTLGGSTASTWRLRILW